jgi:two-component system response regulator AtoC
VRELQNTIERAAVLAEGQEVNEIYFAEVAASDPQTSLPTDRPLKDLLKDETERVEKAYLAALLARFGGSVTKTAEHAGLDRRTIFEKMKQYDLRKEDYK